MKVAFIVRKTFQKIRGGDTIQVEQTASQLHKLGVEVDILSADQNINYEDYDLLHFFNIIRPADLIKHAERSTIPYLVSTIYLDYSLFDLNERGKISKSARKVLGKYGFEYLKNNGRFVLGQDSPSSWQYLLGHKRAMKTILNGASMLLPNSNSEYRRLSSDFEKEWNFRVIPNGVRSELVQEIQTQRDKTHTVVCAGQVYGRKNQLRLIEACNLLNVDLTIIGNNPPNHAKYLKMCKELAGPKTNFVSYMNQKELYMVFAGSRVHALPSWFETTGLVSLEAGALGCRLVVGKSPDTIEYFGNIASMVQPGDVQSIANGIDRELSGTENTSTREHILNNFTWEIAARKTLEAYKEVLS